MKDIPDSISVGPYSIKVTRIKNLILERNHDGEYETTKQEITIDELLKGANMWETFFHEVVEAIDCTFDTKLDHHKISLISTGLAQALKCLYE